MWLSVDVSGRAWRLLHDSFSIALAGPQLKVAFRSDSRYFVVGHDHKRGGQLSLTSSTQFHVPPSQHKPGQLNPAGTSLNQRAQVVLLSTLHASPRRLKKSLASKPI